MWSLLICTMHPKLYRLLEFNETEGIEGTGGTEAIDETDVSHTDVDNADSVATEKKNQSSLFDF